MYIVLPMGLGLNKIYLCGQWRSSIRDGPGHARLGQNPPHRWLHLLGELALGRGVTASCRAPDSRGLLGGSNARALGNQNWGVSCRRWGDLLISKGAIPIESPLLDGFLMFFGGFKLNKLQCIGIISPRMDEVLELVASADFESSPPHSHPVSSLRPRLASLFWASRNCWRAFARGTSSWKTCSLSGCWWSCECRKLGKMYLLNGWTDNLRVQKKSNTH